MTGPAQTRRSRTTVNGDGTPTTVSQELSPEAATLSDDKIVDFRQFAVALGNGPKGKTPLTEPVTKTSRVKDVATAA